MQIQATQSPVNTLATDALLVGVFAETPLDGALAALDETLGGAIASLSRDLPFKAQVGEAETLFRPAGIKAKRLIVVGLGKPQELTAEALRKAFGAAFQGLIGTTVTKAAILLDGVDTLGWEKASAAAVEAAVLASYRYKRYMTKGQDEHRAPDSVTLVLPKSGDLKAAKAGAEEARLVSEAANWVRDLVNTPGGDLTATDLAGEARTMAEARGITCKVLDKKQLEKQGFGALLGVNQGSTEPPAFIILEYQGGKKKDKPVVLVGKGVTFDTGGLCIKPAKGMEEMKTDMGGAGAVLGTLRAAADLKLPINLVGLIPSTDNMPSGSSLKPGDIVKTYNGMTMEIVDTDAEGRVVLSDALGYAAKNYDAKAIIDLATLTGSIIVALGMHVTGMFGKDKDQALLDRIYKAGQETGEKVWQMPTWDVYEDLVKSDIADVKNSDPRRGDAIAGAMLLGKFVGEAPWVHLDIAGPSWAESPKAYYDAGATGHGVRLLTEVLKNWEA
ncbi:Cytosol aminopeptidase [compost metagenome]